MRARLLARSLVRSRMTCKLPHEKEISTMRIIIRSGGSRSIGRNFAKRSVPRAARVPVRGRREKERERESRVAGIRAPFANRSRPSRYRPLAPATRDHQFSSSSSSSSPGFDFYLFNFIVPHVIPCHLTRFYLIRPSFSPVLFHFNSVSSRLISLYFPPFPLAFYFIGMLFQLCFVQRVSIRSCLSSARFMFSLSLSLSLFLYFFPSPFGLSSDPLCVLSSHSVTIIGLQL